jgi:hypothetical protein
MKRVALFIAILFFAMIAAAEDGMPVPVTVDNFMRAETDRTFASIVKDGGFDKFYNFSEVTPLDKQIVPRSNRDTLYSVAVFDLDAGPVTITLPEAGNRFMTMIAIDEDHYVHEVVYGPGVYTFTREKIGTRYGFTAIRILIDPANPKDVEQVHALQHAIEVSQPNGPGRFEAPNWDPVSQNKIRDLLKALGESLPDWNHSAGRKDEVDPVRHLIVTATGWGLNPEKDAIYLNVTPDKNDGKALYRLHVKDVPVDGFWSISVYNAEGFFVKNVFDSYTLNDITAKKDTDGSVTVRFGGCDGKVPNCLPIVKGWNYMVRLYRPHAEIVNGKWAFPKAQPVP